MSAEIIPLFPQQQPAVRSCFDCVHLQGNFCMEFREQIIDERVAASDCPLFETED